MYITPISPGVGKSLLIFTLLCLFALKVCASELSSGAIVTQVAGISSFEVSRSGKTQLVAISSLASARDLRKTLLSNNSKQNSELDGAVSCEVRHLLENRKMVINFLQCLIPPGSPIKLHSVCESGSGRLSASVSFYPTLRQSGMTVDLACMMLGEGFAIPHPRSWDAPSNDPPETEEEWTASIFRYARKNNLGLWGMGKKEHDHHICRPQLAVPLPMVYVRQKKNSQSPCPHIRVGVTLICATREDVSGICASRTWINSVVREYCSGRDLENPDFMSGIETEVLSRLSTSEHWDGQSPNIERVLSRISCSFLREQQNNSPAGR